MKAQYDLKSSGRRWHDRPHDALKLMGFVPTKSEEDIWMQDAGNHYEYIAVYVDDLLIASNAPQAIKRTRPALGPRSPVSVSCMSFRCMRI